MRGKYVVGEESDVRFGLVSNGWYWAGGWGREVFIMVFHRVVYVCWWKRAKRIYNFLSMA